jgi:hypothetical protein
LSRTHSRFTATSIEDQRWGVAGLRIQEGLSLGETDLDQRRGSILSGTAKTNLGREVGMDACMVGDRAVDRLTARSFPVGPRSA